MLAIQERRWPGAGLALIRHRLNQIDVAPVYHRSVLGMDVSAIEAEVRYRTPAVDCARAHKGSQQVS